MIEDKYNITFKTWNKIAELYQEKFMDLDMYNDSYDVFCEEIKSTYPSILEIGCGPGNITKHLLSKIPNAQILATDVAPNMLELAKMNNPKVDTRILDCRKLEEITDTYDAIVCGFCMPYLSKKDVKKLIKDAYSLLNEGGIFYFSTIEGDYNQSGYEAGSTGDKAYVYYHEFVYLENVLEENQYNMTHVIRKEYPKGEEMQIHLIVIAKK